MLVIGASAVLDLLLRTPRAEKIEKRILQAKGNLHAPQLLALEITVALKRYVADGMPLARAEEVLRDLASFPLYRHAVDTHLDRIWQLRDLLTIHDAAYISLAEFLEAPFLTCDHSLASVKGHEAEIEFV